MESIFRTRTFWFNLLSGLGLFIALPELTSTIPPEYVRYLVLLNATINIALRYVTSTPVNLMGEVK